MFTNIFHAKVCEDAQRHSRKVMWPLSKWVIWSVQQTKTVSGQPALTASLCPSADLWHPLSTTHIQKETHTHIISPLAIMTSVLDPFKPFSAELHVIRRLNHSLYGTGGRSLEPGCANGPLARSHPPAEHVSLAPLRCDVPLLDHCCGQLSAGAEVVLGVKGRQKFIDFHHVASALRVPPGFGERPQTAPSPSGVCVDVSEDEAWNSRRIPDEVLKARLSGRTKNNSLYLHIMLITLTLYLLPVLFHIRCCACWKVYVKAGLLTGQLPQGPKH